MGRPKQNLQVSTWFLRNHIERDYVSNQNVGFFIKPNTCLQVNCNGCPYGKTNKVTI